MKLQYSLTASDFIANAAFESRLVRLPFAWLSWVVWGTFLAALFVVSDAAAFPIVLVVVVTAFVLFQCVARLQRYVWIRQNYSADRLRGLAGEQQIEITADYLREIAPNRDVTWKWEDYSRIYETLTYVFVKPTPINTVIIPSTAFLCDSQRSELIALVKSCIEEKKNSPGA